MQDVHAVSNAGPSSVPGSRRLRTVGLICFWCYVGALFGLGLAGVFAPSTELALLYDVDLGTLDASAETTVLHQFRFLKVFVLGVGVWAVLSRRKIFADRLHNRLFVGILFGGIAARLLSVAADGVPGVPLLSFTASELVFGLGIVAATRGLEGDRG